MWDSVLKQKSKLARVKQFYIHVTFACFFCTKTCTLDISWMEYMSDNSKPLQLLQGLDLKTTEKKTQLKSTADLLIYAFYILWPNLSILYDLHSRPTRTGRMRESNLTRAALLKAAVSLKADVWLHFRFKATLTVLAFHTALLKILNINSSAYFQSLAPLLLQLHLPQ